MKKILVRSVIALLVLGLLALIFAGLYLDRIVAKSVEKVGPMITKVPVKVEGVNLSLFSGGGSVNGLEVGNPEGFKTPTAIKVGSAEMKLSPGSLFSDKIVIRTINVQAPEITFETDLKGNNLSKILANIEETTGGSSQPGEPSKGGQSPGKKLQVDDFVISGAKLKVSITTMGGQSVTVLLPEIHLQNMGQGPEGITAAGLLQEVFAKLQSVSAQAASTAVNDLGAQGIEAAKGAAEKGTSTATEKLKEGVGGLFKRK